MRLDYRFISVDLLRAYKELVDYKELEEITGLDTQTLWRYIRKGVKPNSKKAASLFNKLTSREIVERLIKRELVELENGIYSLYRIAYNIPLIKILSYIALKEFREYRINAVATVESDGIPLATKIADVMNAKLVVAKHRPEIGAKGYHQTSYVSRDPPVYTMLFTPVDILIKKDRVLIVDDLINTGKTSRAMIQLIKAAGAQPVGLFSIIGIGDSWFRVISRDLEKIYVTLVITELQKA
ncbi:MAG: phosphoribosyltransferase family protein [Desulfurococcus sp.]|uniref:phosphoribosyltransferase family protein n=1 Tax=Desulfurococcus sp. TaxID=51678 RepID=UPI0031607322